MHKDAEIQSLRGIAVILVTLYHFDLFFGQGWIGVDIFFVISGYVVTKSVLRQFRSTGSFSGLNFLQARFRRLAPALMLMTSSVLAFLLVFSPFPEWSYALQSSLNVLAWTSNIHSQIQLGDYFAETAGTSPFLHTWSLSVEFQTYLFLAFIFCISMRLQISRNYRIALFSILTFGGISFLGVGLSMLFQEFGASAIVGYYSPFTRFWQFALGAALAFGYFVRKPSNVIRKLSTLSLIILALFPESDTNWQLYSIAATICSGVFIASLDVPGVPRREVSLLTRIGDYSYSIYLWHWPISVFTFSILESKVVAVGLGISLTVILSIFSYKFAESPYLSRPNTGGDRKSSGFQKLRANSLLLYLSTITVVGGLLISSNSLMPQGSPETLGYSVKAGSTSEIEFQELLNEILKPCPNADSELSQNVGIIYDCYSYGVSSSPEFLVVGNSHAAHLLPGLIARLQPSGLIYLRTEGSLVQDSPSFQKALGWGLESDLDETILVISSFWEEEAVELHSLKNLINAVSPRKTWIFNGVPQFKIQPERCKHSAGMVLPAPCEERLLQFETHLKDFETNFQVNFPDFSKTYLVDSAGFFSTGRGTYQMATDHELLFRDQNHLNQIGSESLISGLLESEGLP